MFGDYGIYSYYIDMGLLNFITKGVRVEKREPQTSSRTVDLVQSHEESLSAELNTPFSNYEIPAMPNMQGQPIQPEYAQPVQSQYGQPQYAQQLPPQYTPHVASQPPVPSQSQIAGGILFENRVPEPTVWANQQFDHGGQSSHGYQSSQPNPTQALQSHVVPNLNTGVFNNEERTTGGERNILVVVPVTNQDVTMITKNLQVGEACIINLSPMELADARRRLDFLSGVISALGGTIKAIDEKKFILTPPGLGVR